MSARLPSGAALVALDVLLAVWVVAWVWLGFAVSEEIEGLQELSGTVTEVGVALERTGTTLGSLGGVPFVGDQVEEAAASIERAGTSAVSSGRESRESVDSLSWMLGLAIGVLPSVPVIGFYLPLRLTLRRR